MEENQDRLMKIKMALADVVKMETDLELNTPEKVVFYNSNNLDRVLTKFPENLEQETMISLKF